MARNAKKSDIDLSPESMEACERLIALAHQLSAVLTGDALSPETGQVETPRSAALVMGMLAFLLRADPDDLHAMFFAEKSLNQFPYRAGPVQPMRHPPLAAMLG
ncbi:MAG TPA: hypothetical protein VIZ90_11530 [Rhizobiaceae bacterium]